MIKYITHIPPPLMEFKIMPISKKFDKPLFSKSHYKKRLKEQEKDWEEAKKHQDAYLATFEPHERPIQEDCTTRNN